MTSIDSSAKSGIVSISGNEGMPSFENENAALFETLFGLMQTATDMPDAMDGQTGIMVESAGELDGGLAALPAIIASVPLGSVSTGDEKPLLPEHVNSFVTPLDDTASDQLNAATPDLPKIEISDGALAMAQTLLVAQSVGLVDAVADPNANADTPATLDLKIETPTPMLKHDLENSEPDFPVAVPAELFAKARALVKGEVASPSRNNYDTGPQPVHQLMNFLKRAVVTKDDKSSRVQPLPAPLSDEAMPNIISQPAGAFVTYDTPHTVISAQGMAGNTASMPRIVDIATATAATSANTPTAPTAPTATPAPAPMAPIATAAPKATATAPTTTAAAPAVVESVTYDETHTVLSAQQLAKLESAAPMPAVMSKSAGNVATYDTPHTVMTAQDVVAKTPPMPIITGKVTGDAVLYDEAHMVIEPQRELKNELQSASKEESKGFDISQSAKHNKMQRNTVIESGVTPSAPKDVAARASIILDNGAIRLNSEKPAPQRMVNDTASITQTSDSSNGSGAQNNNSKGDGGGFDQASRGNTQIMTAHRLNMADKSWHEGFVRRIENSIKNGDSVIRIALEPRQLGRMQVKLGFQGDATRIQITTETAAAAAMLSEGEGRLNQMFEQAGLRLGNLQTNATGSSGFDQNNHMGGQANSGQADTSAGNGDQSGHKSQTANLRGETEIDEETPNTLENNNKTVLNILA